MADLATLSIAIDSSRVKTASQDLDRMTDAAKGAERYIGNMAKQMAALSGILVGASFALMARQIYTVNAEFQRLHASLETVTGGADAASKAFGMIQRLAIQTPFEVTELTQALVDLKTRGMDASVASMTSYGNMASSFGRSVTDTIRAISGVSMGETEAIKSFGVMARVQGERIALTFKGQTEVVQRTTSAVEAYFKRLADSNFAGGMERQARTIGGAMSNLQDQISATMFEMGNAGASGLMGDGIRGLTQALSEATPALVRFTDGFTNGVRVAVQMANDYKAAAAALAAVALAVKLNAWIVALSGIIAVKARAVVMTVALEMATLKYAGSAGVASAATAGLKMAFGALMSPVGVLTVGLGALYLALKPIRDEIKALDEQSAAMAARTAKAQPIMDAAERIREIKAETETMRKILAGDKNARLLSGESQGLINQVSRDGGDVVWAKIKAKQMDAAQAENKIVKDQMDARNKAIQEAAFHERKIAAERAQHAQAEAERRAKFVDDLQLQYEKLGKSELELMQIEIQRANLTKGQNAEALKIADQIGWKKAFLESEKAILATEKERLNVRKQLEPKRDVFSQYLSEIEVLDPTRKDQQRIDSDRQSAENWKHMVTAKQYQEALARINYEQVRLRAQAGDLWCNMALQVESNSARMADAMGNWMNGTKSGFRDMTADILKQLQRLAIEMMIIKPIMDAVMGYFGAPKTTTNFTIPVEDMKPIPMNAMGGSVYGSMPSIVGERGPELFMPGVSGTIIPNHAMGGAMGGTTNNNTSINVTVSNEGTKTQTNGGADARRLGDMIGAKVREVICTEQRTGGMLARA